MLNYIIRTINTEVIIPGRGMVTLFFDLESQYSCDDINKSQPQNVGAAIH